MLMYDATSGPCFFKDDINSFIVQVIWQKLHFNFNLFSKVLYLKKLFQ